MNNSLNRIEMFFDRRPPRERIAIFSSIMVFIFWMWLSLLAKPLWHSAHNNGATIDVVKKNVSTLNAEKDTYQSIISLSDSAYQKQMQRLESQLISLERNPLLSKKPIRQAADLQSVLQALAQTGPLLSLNQIQNVSATAASASSPTFLNQKILVKFYGDYFATLHYLEYVENLPWYLSFESVDYEVGQYPNAKVTIVLNALGAPGDSTYV